MSLTEQALLGLTPNQKTTLRARLFTGTHVPLKEGLPDLTRPWLWQGALDKDGYGRITVPGTGQKVGVHRAMYFLTNGHLPQVVRHRHPGRELRRDVNPMNLRAGTQQDNMDDRSAQRRTARGSRNGRAKLVEEEVAVIKAELDAGTSQRKLARRFGVHNTTIRDIAGGRIWRHVAPAAPQRRAA